MFSPPENFNPEGKLILLEFGDGPSVRLYIRDDGFNPIPEAVAIADDRSLEAVDVGESVLIS